MRILGIAGSLRRGSHNRKLLRAAGGALPPGAVFVEWDGLGGYDTALGLLREDVDYGWRVNRAGGLVLCAPSARLRHARALSSRTRPLDTAGVDKFLTRATLEGPHEIKLADRVQAVSAKTVLVATGGHPMMPEVPGK